VERADLMAGVIIPLKWVTDTYGHIGQLLLDSFFASPSAYWDSLSPLDQTEIKSIVNI